MIRNKLALLAVIAPLAMAAPEVTETRYKDWTQVCLSEAEVSRCEAIQVLNVTQDEQTRPLLRATLSRVPDGRFLEIALPLGMDLRAGLVIQIDEGDEQRFAYSTCVAQGCAAVLAVDEALLSALRAGNRARLGFRLFGTVETQVVELSLSGFTAASEGV